MGTLSSPKRWVKVSLLQSPPLHPSSFSPVFFLLPCRGLRADWQLASSDLRSRQHATTNNCRSRYCKNPLVPRKCPGRRSRIVSRWTIQAKCEKTTAIIMITTTPAPRDGASPLRIIAKLFLFDLFLFTPRDVYVSACRTIRATRWLRFLS